MSFNFQFTYSRTRWSSQQPSYIQFPKEIFINTLLLHYNFKYLFIFFFYLKQMFILRNCIDSQQVARVFLGRGGTNMKFITNYQQLTGDSEFLMKRLHHEGGGVQTSWTPRAMCLLTSNGLAAESYFVFFQLYDPLRISSAKTISYNFSPSNAIFR